MRHHMLSQGENHFQSGDLKRATLAFEQVLREDPDCLEAMNNLGVIAFQQGLNGVARGWFEKALHLRPDFKEAAENLRQLDNSDADPGSTPASSDPGLTNTKLAIIDPLENKFVQLWVDYFSRHNQVKVFVPRSTADVDELADWADLIWSAWANEPLMYLSQQKLPVPLVTHIRSYEILTDDLMEGIRWTNLTAGIFVADHIQDIALSMWPDQLTPLKRIVINNCVDTDAYPAYEKQPGCNIAYIGYLGHKKGIGLLLQCLAAAVAVNPDYRLHIAGEFQEPRFEVYTRHLIHEMGLDDQVVFHGWLRDIPNFLRDMDYVISTSPWEGCPNNVIEAMTCGVKPLVHNWRGAIELFGRELVFNTVAEFVAMLLSPDYNSHHYRQTAERRYSVRQMLPRLDAFLASCLHQSVSR